MEALSKRVFRQGYYKKKTNCNGRMLSQIYQEMLLEDSHKLKRENLKVKWRYCTIVEQQAKGGDREAIIWLKVYDIEQMAESVLRRLNRCYDFLARQYALNMMYYGKLLACGEL